MAAKAYYISGHGEDHDSVMPTFVVPPGCTIVVLAHRGESIYSQSGTMAKFCSLHPGVIKNPLMFAGDLAEAFRPWGSLAFYKEGDICPNFSYILRACYEDEGITRCERFGSGILDFDLIKKDACDAMGASIDSLSSYYFGTEVFDESERFGDDLGAFFEAQVQRVVAAVKEQFLFSVFPPPQWVAQKLSTPEAQAAITAVYTTIFDNDSPDESIFDDSAFEKAFKAALIHLESLYGNDVTQHYLCSRLSGVFYNFVCREENDVDPLFKLNTNITSIRSVRDPNISWATATNGQRTQMRSHLMELIQRKPAIRNLYEGKKYRSTRSKRRNLSHLAAVKSVSHRSSRRSKKGGRRH